MFDFEAIHDEELALLLIDAVDGDQAVLLTSLLYARPVYNTLYLAVLLDLRQVHQHRALQEDGR